MIAFRETRPALTAALIFLLAASAPAAGAPPSQKQRFVAAMSLQSSAPEDMAREMRILASEGYARAADRLAYFTFKGIGVPRDADASIALYRQAVAAGRTSSLVSLGKVQLTVGDHAAAIETLRQASESGYEKAGAVLAWAHATRRLGDFSSPANGLETLEELAGEDQRDAQIYLLDASVRMRARVRDIDRILDRLHERLDEGDTSAAEALARYYRAQGHPRGTLEIRAGLLGTHGIRDKIRIEEGLYLARDRQPGQFWKTSEALVQSAPPDVYARALTVTARINKNAYVRILQKDLQALGYSAGPPSPYLNASLIRAVNRFCRDNGLADSCRMGPLKSATIKAVAAKLAELRTAA